ncbi:unnamed protein product [Dicrocoelium dendriticum]|nr:unnamed protein product [Dicrocoelium dendriticum]
MAQLDACFKLLQRRDELQQLKMQDLEQKITDHTLEHTKQMQQLRQEHSNEMHENQQLFHKEILQAIKRAELATVEAKKLSLEATNLKSIMEAEMKAKTEEIGRLKKVLGEKERTECEPQHETGPVKNHSQQEIARLINERDAAVSKHSVLTTKLEAVEAYMSELESREMNDSKKFLALQCELREANQRNKKLKRHLEDVVKWINNFNAMVAEYFDLPVEKFSGNSTRIERLHAFAKEVQLKCKSVEFTSHQKSLGGKLTYTSPCNFNKTKRRLPEEKQQLSDVHEELGVCLELE